MSLEARIAKLEASRATPATYVFCESGVPLEQANEAIYIRWLEPAEAAPAPVPEPPAPVPVVPPPEPAKDSTAPAANAAKPAIPNRPCPTHPNRPRPPTAAGWT